MVKNKSNTTRKAKRTHKPWPHFSVPLQGPNSCSIAWCSLQSVMLFSTCYRFNPKAMPVRVVCFVRSSVVCLHQSLSSRALALKPLRHLIKTTRYNTLSRCSNHVRCTSCQITLLVMELPWSAEMVGRVCWRLLHTHYVHTTRVMNVRRYLVEAGQTTQ